MEIHKNPESKISINNNDYLYFSGTSYLGVSTNAEFQNQLIKSIKKWGTSYGSSRNANIKLSIYKKGEDFLANFLEKEEALTVSSGTIAGQFALKVLKEKIDTFFYMPKTHPAILPENSLPVFIENVLNTKILNIKDKNICIVTDGIAALEIAPFSFSFLKFLPKSTKITLLIDESHSLGVLGNKGEGISPSLNVPNNVEIIIVSSLGKAFGVTGGVIAGKSTFINSVKKDSLFIGCAGMNPAFLDCFINSKKLYESQLLKLRENIKYILNHLKKNKEIKMDELYPVFFHNDENIGSYLFSKNIVITSFTYPTSIKKINRIVLNANHTKEELEELVNNLK